MKKTCTQCGRKKDPAQYGKWSRGRDGLNARCKVCWAERNKEYRRTHKAEAQRQHKQWRKDNVEKWKSARTAWCLRLKTEVMSHYSNGVPKCHCCGDCQIVFLAIDHMSGGGRQHRLAIRRMGGQGFYVWLRDHDFPTGFRVLCHNCNHAFHVLGYCPHHVPEDRLITAK